MTSRTDGIFHALVIDNGPGVSPEDRERIFEKFSRGWSRQSEGDGSVGLGLAISRQIVRGLGGEVSVQDAPGGGSCFRVSLPCSEPARATPKREPAGEASG